MEESHQPSERARQAERRMYGMSFDLQRLTEECWISEEMDAWIVLENIHINNMGKERSV